ncbi:flagellar biosynthesis anti-sigma factor FlgM [Bacillaceae bacterium W0354]
MKINPTNGTNLNPYVKNLNKQASVKNSHQKSDQLEISSKAKELQKGNPIAEARAQKVSELKEQVQNGEYEIDAKKTAEKMIDFWTNRRL